jgi:hypothetical protein
LRLLTAIPLLFWVGTAAVAQFVHACTAVPMDVAADLSTADRSAEPAFSDDATARPDSGRAFLFECQVDSNPAVVLAPSAAPVYLRTGGRVVREQVFASARLLANPPPSVA